MPDWAKCGWLAVCWLDMELAAYVALQSTNSMVGYGYVGSQKAKYA